MNVMVSIGLIDLQVRDARPDYASEIRRLEDASSETPVKQRKNTTKINLRQFFGANVKFQKNLRRSALILLLILLDVVVVVVVVFRFGIEKQVRQQMNLAIFLFNILYQGSVFCVYSLLRRQTFGDDRRISASR